MSQDPYPIVTTVKEKVCTNTVLRKVF
jgi:hypothetical protein